MNDIRHIGIFDSGVGGLSVANLIYDRFPACSITYLADNAFFPFGERDEQVIYDRLVKCIEILENLGCQNILIACNTASVVFDKYNIESRSNVLTITQSVIDAINHHGSAREFHVMATKLTIKSYFYQREIQRLYPDAAVYGHALPEWVEFVESELGGSEQSAIPLDINPLPGSVMLLACTHFSFIQDRWKSMLETDIDVIDSSTVMANALEDSIYDKEIDDTKRQYRFIFTDGIRPNVALSPKIPWLSTPLPFGEIV